MVSALVCWKVSCPWKRFPGPPSIITVSTTHSVTIILHFSPPSFFHWFNTITVTFVYSSFFIYSLSFGQTCLVITFNFFFTDSISKGKRQRWGRRGWLVQFENPVEPSQDFSKVGKLINLTFPSEDGKTFDIWALYAELEFCCSCSI